MNVIKRSGAIEKLTKKKIFDSIAKANGCVNDDCILTVRQIQRITDSVFSACEEFEEPIPIDKIEDMIEKKLMEASGYEVAKAYITYRYEKEKARNQKTLADKLFAKDVANQNANIDEHSFTGRIGEAASAMMKQFALDNLISAKSKQNHINNEIYIHDLDHYAIGDHNCLSIPFDKLLAEGFNTRQVDIRPAQSVNTAFQLVAVIFQLQSLQQFGGVSATHLDWTMVPYVRKSFIKHYKDGLRFISGVGNPDIEIAEVLNERHLRDIDISVEDEYFQKDSKAYMYAVEKTMEELCQAVEGMYHNLNSLQSRSGGQVPFTSINYGTCTLAEGQWVIEALLSGSIKGLGKFHRTSIFPCGIFQLAKGINRESGDPNYYLFQLALKSTAKRLYPNYANVDWSGNAGYDKNDPKTYFSTMGCHAKNTRIIMADGSYKFVQDIVVGDKVMGVNSQPRTVTELIRGNGNMVSVKQSRASSYIVNEDHVLSLEYSVNRKYKGFKRGDRITMSVREYLALPEYIRRHFKGYKSGYDLDKKEFLIPPYILGLWLGDGMCGATKFSVNENEKQIVNDLREYALSIGKDITVKKDPDESCLSVNVGDANTRTLPNKMMRGLKEYDLIRNKHIPECYFYGSKEQRSELLAGLINTDGWVRRGRGRKSICFGNTNYDLIVGAKRLADSLGYATNIIKARGATTGVGICEDSPLLPYYHLNIHGFTDPHLMENKNIVDTSKLNRNFNTSTLKIEYVGEGDYYGFNLDGDRLYLFEDCTVTHNCRTANGTDINAESGTNPQTKDGRGNICPVTIILPTLAMEAVQAINEEYKKYDPAFKNIRMSKFMELLDKKIHEAKDMLIERFDWICSQPADSSKFMYENGVMLGYHPEEGIRSALKHGTLAIGQLGLAEALQILFGYDHTTEDGMDKAKEIEQLFKDRCAEFKKKYKLNFGVYYTPAENLCKTALEKFKAKYGEIKDVSDKKFFTNSMHVPVWHKLNPFEKIDIESQLTGYSNAGCITYVELDASVINNTYALEELINYAMDKDIPYFAINVPSDLCQKCGHQGEINGSCPVCGSDNIQRLRRVTGYLTGDYTTAFNTGKQQEVEMRVKHSGIQV